MEIYILDELLRRKTLIDEFISCIWTERFAAYGDFELSLLSTPQNRRIFITGALLACNRSNYVMRVKTIEDTVDQEGRPILKVKGVSLEQMLETRVAFGVLDDLTTTPKWVITDAPADVARKIFHDICVTGILDTADIIPYLSEGTFLPADTIPEPLDPITVELDPQTVYDAIKNICVTWSLGFRIIRRDNPALLFFDIYSGNDRTTKQDIFPAVLFTPELDNLQNTSELASVEDYRNVAYVFSPAGYEVVYPADVNPDTAGFERHVLVVKADDITDDNPDPSAAMIQKGLEELAQHRSFSAFDGEIDQNSNYQYMVDYYLGDLVEVRNVDGNTNDM